MYQSSGFSGWSSTARMYSRSARNTRPCRSATRPSARNGSAASGLKKRAHSAWSRALSGSPAARSRVGLALGPIREPRERERDEHGRRDEDHARGEERPAPSALRAPRPPPRVRRARASSARSRRGSPSCSRRARARGTRRARDERGGCGPFRPVEPTKRTRARSSAREHESHEQPEPDDTSVGEVLQRHAVRLDDVARVLTEALPRELEGSGARALRPVVRVHVERLLPPAQAQIQIE